MTTVNPMSAKEFRESGLLAEVNRAVLHPVGLALSVDISDDGEVTLGPIYQDDDPEGWVFATHDGNGVNLAEANRKYRERLDRFKEARKARQGWIVQPPSGPCPCDQCRGQSHPAFYRLVQKLPGADMATAPEAVTEMINAEVARLDELTRCRRPDICNFVPQIGSTDYEHIRERGTMPVTVCEHSLMYEQRQAELPSC